MSVSETITAIAYGVMVAICGLFLGIFAAAAMFWSLDQLKPKAMRALPYATAAAVSPAR